MTKAMCRGTRSLSKGNGPVSLFIVSTYCRFLRSASGPVAGRPSGASAPDHATGFRSTAQRGSAVWVQRHAGPVAGQRDAAPVPLFAFAGCVRLGKEDMGAAARRRSASAGVPLFALRHTTKLCSVTSCCKNSPETGEFCFVSQPFLWRLAPTGPRREARKGSGKNLVFPRGTAAASPNDLQVILALCQNNTPPMAQEGPGGFRRWEETWGNTRRSGCSGY